MSKHVDEDELRELFAEIEAPPGLDKWRERIADVHVEEHEPAGDGVVTQLRPRTHKKRSLAVAAAVVAVVGLGGAVVTSRLLTDAPPADPTMIIDGPDRTQSSPPPPSTGSSAPGTGTSPPPVSGQPTGQENQQGGSGADGSGGDDDPVSPGDDGGPEPAWGPMTGDPSVSNTGVPQGATLREHQGNLRITTAGQVVSDLRVTGTVIVEAPNVTLRRVVAVSPYGVPALQQLAANLTIVDSELSGGESLQQRAGGLVVRRSRLESGMTVAGGAEMTDSYLGTSDVQVSAGATGVLLRHNVMGRVTMSDLDGPIRNATVEDSVLTLVNAPTEPGSASIHVLNNRFRSSAPSTGWNSAATDYQWSGNSFLDTGAPAGP